MTSHDPRQSPQDPSLQSMRTDHTVVARASLVNRTHRIVRERAVTQSDRRTRLKSLGIPLAICSALLIILSTGAWISLAQNDLSPTGIPDASDQMLVFALWFFPASAALLAMVWFKRTPTPSSSEPTR